MEGVQVIKDGFFICFFNDGLCFYDITIDQVTVNGIGFWLSHLSSKNWFTDDVKRKFLELVNNE